MSEAEISRILIETPIDQLIELIKQKKKVPLSKAASYLNVPETQVEQWVKVLEEKGFLRLMYPPIGEPYVVLGEIPPKKLDHKIKEFQKKKEEIGGKVYKMEEKITEAEARVEITDQKFVRLQEDLYKNLETVEEDLKDLEDIEEKRREIVAGAREVEDYSERAVQHLDKVKENMKEMDKRIKDQLEELQSHEGVIGDLESERIRLEKEMEVLDREIKLVRLIARSPQAPVLEEFKEILKKQRERTAKVKERKEEIHKRVMKIKKESEKKKRKVRKKEVDQGKMILMKLTKHKKTSRRRIRKMGKKIKKKIKRKKVKRRSGKKHLKKKIKKLRLKDVTRR